MPKQVHSIVNRSWQALLVIALLWAQLASAHHLHLQDANSSKDHSVAECLTCQQLSNDDNGAYQAAVHPELCHQHKTTTEHYSPYSSQRQPHAAIRAPPQQP